MGESTDAAKTEYARAQCDKPCYPRGSSIIDELRATRLLRNPSSSRQHMSSPRETWEGLLLLLLLFAALLLLIFNNARQPRVMKSIIQLFHAKITNGAVLVTIVRYSLNFVIETQKFCSAREMHGINLSSGRCNLTTRDFIYNQNYSIFTFNQLFIFIHSSFNSLVSLSITFKNKNIDIQTLFCN